MPRRPTGWSITRTTDYTGCERCKEIKPPILEVCYMASKGSHPQWHYLCQECVQHVCGACQVASGAGVDRSHPDQLVHAGGR